MGISNLFSSPRASQAPVYGIRVQKSLQGVPRTIGWGRARLAPNLIWYGDFQQFENGNPPGQGSKGTGVANASGKGNNTGTTYQASFMLDLCEGPIAGVVGQFANGAVVQTIFFYFKGDYNQLPWSYLQTFHPASARAYRGHAFVALANYNIGSSPSLPSYTFEILFGINTDLPNVLAPQVIIGVNGQAIPFLAPLPDANPKDVITDFLTNSHYGLPGWPAGILHDLTLLQTWCRVNNLLISPVLDQQRAAQSFLQDMAKACVFDYRWTGGLLDAVPYGDQQISANGYVYNPPVQPVYAFGPNDYLDNSKHGSLGSSGVQGKTGVAVHRKPQHETLNSVRMKYLDRSLLYNPVTLEYKDEADIVATGRYRPSDLRQFDFFCYGTGANTSCALQLQRERIQCQYQITVSQKFILADPMDICTLTNPPQGMAALAVRITEIKENDDQSLTFTFEDYLGTVGAPLYGSQPPLGFVPGYNVDPGPVNQPIVIEPSAELAAALIPGGGLCLAVGVCGQVPSTWGGTYVYASYDNLIYDPMGIIPSAARMGVLATSLPSVAASATGPTIDQVNVPKVDLTESESQLNSAASTASALALNTACYVGPALGPGGTGEIIAYETAMLVAANEYDLAYLVRGAYGTETEIATWPAGTPFLRLDNNVVTFLFDQSRIGSIIYLKFLSFNKYGGGLETLAGVPAYRYVIAGSALASPLPNVTNLRTVFNANIGFNQLVWDKVSDFRNPTYQVKSGASFSSAYVLDGDAQSPFTVPGDGTYWVTATAQPAPGLEVFSETPQSVTIAGSVITQNVVLTIDLQGAGWPGTFSGGAGIDSTLHAIRTGGGNILSDPNILTTPSVLDYGSSQSGAYYPAGAFLDIGYVATASVVIKYLPTGVPVGSNILAIGNILTTPDVLGSESTAYISVFPQINTSSTPGGDLYSLGDLYQSIYPDLYVASAAVWNGWQKFAPGTYQTRFLDFQMQLETFDPNTIAYNLAFKITVTIPARIDTYALTTSASADTTVTFEPTGAASTAPFNGGPGPGNLPALNWGITNAQAGDDLIVTALSLSAISFKILNGGARVVRSLTLTAEGY